MTEKQKELFEKELQSLKEYDDTLEATWNPDEGGGFPSQKDLWKLLYKGEIPEGYGGSIGDLIFGAYDALFGGFRLGLRKGGIYSGIDENIKKRWEKIEYLDDQLYNKLLELQNAVPKDYVSPTSSEPREPEGEEPRKPIEPEKGIDKVSFSFDGFAPGYEPIGDFPWSKSKVYVRDKRWMSYLRSEKNKPGKKRGKSEKPLVEINIKDSKLDSILKTIIYNSQQLPQWT